MVFFSKSDNKTYLKGTTGGDIVGILDGELTESVPGSGRYDSYAATWQINRVRTELISGKLTLNGTISRQDSTDYPSTGLDVIQTMVEGTTAGHYTGPLTTMLTQVLIANPDSIYQGQGFSILSYSSNEGSGEGWTFDKQQRPGITELHGFFSVPLNGIIRGTLDETSPPMDLFLTLERMDLGIPPVP